MISFIKNLNWIFQMLVQNREITTKNYTFFLLECKISSNAVHEIVQLKLGLAIYFIVKRII